MNPHLALLVGPVFGGALAPDHLADLRKSGLHDDLVAEQGIRSVPPGMIGRLLGFDVSVVQSACLFPFPAPRGGFTDHVRVKVFPALQDGDGHSVKYLQPKGSAPRLYFVRRCLAAVRSETGPLWVVEGEKKALAVAQLGMPAVGFGGAEGWHRKGTPDLIDDFSAIPLRGRVVELLPDGDVQTNVNVADAMRRFVAALRAAGANPRLRLLPKASAA